MNRGNVLKGVDAAYEAVRQLYLKEFEANDITDMKGMALAAVKLHVLKDVVYDLKAAIEKLDEVSQ